MPNRLTTDGMEIVLPALFPLTTQYAVCGAGDDPTQGRGKGPAFVFASDPTKNLAGTYSPSTTSIQFGFNDWALFAGGGVDYDGAMAGDTLDLMVSCPASTVTAASSASGNCNLVAVSASINMIVPAAGNGAYNLATANPVTAVDSTPHLNNNGYWEWCDSTIATQISGITPDTALPPNAGAGSVVPTAVPGTGSYNLLTAGVNIAHFLIALPLNGSHSRKIAPQIKPKRILPQWQMTASLYNCGHTGLRVTFYLEVARVYTT